MSEIQIIETGEVVSRMTEVEAERITARIADKLDAIADNLEQVLPLISEALTRDAWKPLGYASPTAYVSERFAGALGRLSPDVRRPVVAELSAAGMSTRAIAPIVGKSVGQVHADKAAAVQWLNTSDSPRATRGLDGKTYTRTAPSVPTAPSASSALSPDEIYDEETGEIISTTPEPEKTPEQKKIDKDLTLINDIRLYLGHMSRSRQVKNMSPTAKQHIINALEDTISAIKGETS